MEVPILNDLEQRTALDICLNTEPITTEGAC